MLLYATTKAKKIWWCIYCIFVFVIGWVIFRAENMSYAYQYIQNMFNFSSIQKTTYDLSYYIDRLEIIAFIAAILCSLPLFRKILEINRKKTILRVVVNVWLMFLFFCSTMCIAASTYNPFIYFRF